MNVCRGIFTDCVMCSTGSNGIRHSRCAGTLSFAGGDGGGDVFFCVRV